MNSWQRVNERNIYSQIQEIQQIPSMSPKNKSICQQRISETEYQRQKKIIKLVREMRQIKEYL